LWFELFHLRVSILASWRYAVYLKHQSQMFTVTYSYLRLVVYFHLTVCGCNIVDWFLLSGKWWWQKWHRFGSGCSQRWGKYL